MRRIGTPPHFATPTSPGCRMRRDWLALDTVRRQNLKATFAIGTPRCRTMSAARWTGYRQCRKIAPCRVFYFSTRATAVLMSEAERLRYSPPKSRIDAEPSHTSIGYIASAHVSSIVKSTCLEALRFRRRRPDRPALHRAAAWRPLSSSPARRPLAQEYETPARRRRSSNRR